MRKEIYVSDGDAELIDLARELAGEESLSAIVVKALREWVDTRRAMDAGMQVFEVQPLVDGYEGRAIKFKGVLLVTQTYPGSGKYADQTYDLYQTAAGKIVAVHDNGEGVFVDVFSDLDNVTRFNTQNTVVGGKEDGEVAVPRDVWEMAKVSLGEMPPRWIA